MSGRIKLLVWIALKYEDFVGGIRGRQLERLDRPFNYSLHRGRRGKRFVLCFVVKHRHFYTAAVMTVDVVTVPDFALGKLPMVLNRFLTVLEKNEDFFVPTFAHATSSADSLKELLDRGILIRLDELRLQALVGVNINFDLFHILFPVYFVIADTSAGFISR
jgi:hypothetical protein